MNKTLLIAAASVLSLSISAVLSAGEIERAQRHAAPLEQNVVEMSVDAVESNVDTSAQTELELGLGSNAEVQDLGFRWTHRSSGRRCAGTM